METVLINKLKALGASNKLVDFIDRNFIHYDLFTVRLVNTISLFVYDHFNIPVDFMNVKHRKRDIVQVRQVAHYFCRKYTRGSYQLIGDLVGNKDHATVLSSCNTVQNIYDTDKRFAETMDRLDKLIDEHLTKMTWQKDSPTPQSGKRSGSGN